MTKKPGRVKAAILNWLGVPIGLTDEAFWSSYGLQSAGQPVNEKTMLQLSAVWACARLISETISTLPLGLYRRTPSGRMSARNHPLYSILHDQPNADSTASVFWESVVAAMLLRGNAFAEKQMIGDRVVALKFLSPNRLSKEKDSQGNLKFYYQETGNKKRLIPESRIFRIPGFTTNGEWGLSVVEYGAGVFGSALAASTAANSTFENGLMPTTYFKFPHVVKKEQREDFRQSLTEISGAMGSGKTALLEAGMEVGTVGINPNDAQLLESRSFSIEEICRWFRVPPSMVGHSEKSTSWGTGIEQQMIGFLTFTLRPWLTRIEQAISKDLLTPAERLEYYAEYSIEGLLRADSAGRAAFYSSMVNNGIMTRDEVRVKENYETRGGNADVLTVQMALTPIDKLGEANAQ